MLENIKNIIKEFDIEGELIDCRNNNDGIINDTYVLTFRLKEGSEKKYLLQKINSRVFHEPYKLMKNISQVTSYLKKKVKRENENHRTLEIVKTKSGKSLCQIKDNTDSIEYFRIYEYIDNAISYNNSKDPNVIFNTGKAFGNFQKLLRNYPISELEETIKSFHDTKLRYNGFIKDVRDDTMDRVKLVTKEIVFLIQRGDKSSLIVDELAKGTIPYRVTHNDTKVSNVLLNKEDNSYLAVIDLDTVMPGSLLNDFGDGVRSNCSSAKEDETDLSKVYLDLDLFASFTDGFMSEMAPYIEERELDLMAESIRILTYELAIRFLDDYINGDTYFKIEYETHNLDRARNQIKLIYDIEAKMEQIEDYIYESYEKYKCESKESTGKRKIKSSNGNK